MAAAAEEERKPREKLPKQGRAKDKEGPQGEDEEEDEAGQGRGASSKGGAGAGTSRTMTTKELTSTVGLLAKMNLRNCQEIRQCAASTSFAMLTNQKNQVATTMEEQYKIYEERREEWDEQKRAIWDAEEDDEVDEVTLTTMQEELGPPPLAHMFRFKGMLVGIMEEMGKQGDSRAQQLAETIRRAKERWMDKSYISASLLARQCRVKVTRAGKKAKGGKAGELLVTLGVDRRMVQVPSEAEPTTLEEVIVEALMKAGWQYRGVVAPESAMEQAAKKVVQGKSKGKGRGKRGKKNSEEED